MAQKLYTQGSSPEAHHALLLLAHTRLFKCNVADDTGEDSMGVHQLKHLQLQQSDQSCTGLDVKELPR